MAPTFAFLREHVVADDVAGESRGALAAVTQRLAQRGLSLADVAKMRMLYTEPSDYVEMNTVRDPLFRETFRDDDFPCATGVITGGRGGASPRVEFEVVACDRRVAANSSQVIRQFGDMVPPFVHLNDAGGVALVSGQGGFDLQGRLVGATPAEQARAAFATMAPILAEGGRTLADVAAVTAYVVPAACRGADGAAIFAELRRFVDGLGDPAPLVTCLGVRDLAFAGMLVEVDVVAGPPGAARAAHPGSGVTALGAVTRASARTTCGPLVLASVTGRDAEDGAAAIAVAVAELAVALEGVELAPGALLTAWHDAGVERDALEAAVAARWPAAQRTVAPMQVHDGRRAVTLELMGQAS